MKVAIAAALALTASPSLAAQAVPANTNLTYDVPIVGNWSYATTATGSEATFTDSASRPQLTIRCTRATRRIAIAKAASVAAPYIWVWTSSQVKNVPATYDATTAQVVGDVAAFDPLLDAIASSRGRVGFSTSGLAALVVPPWADVGRVIEDCRV
ncbi:MAG TPA: hypothetical protein VFN86_08460 [Casimicrobiaceae bacterium]|nr:hypothetical protein [Casimicrobiaceae bacterium]